MAFHGFKKAAALTAALTFGLGGIAFAQTQATAPSPAATSPAAPAAPTAGTPAAGAPAAMSATKPTGTMASGNMASGAMSHGKLPNGDRFTTTAAATAHCPNGTVVWSTLSKSHAYHLASSKYFGKTKHGAYVCKADADAAGFHAANN